MKEILEHLKTLLGLKELPDGKELSGFSEEQLADAVTKAKEAFDSAKESSDLAGATLARDVIKAVKAEMSQREEAAAAVEKELADLEAEIAAETETQDEESEETDEADDTDADEEEVEQVEVETEESPAAEETTEVEVEAPAEEPEKEPATVAASLSTAPAKPKRPAPKSSGKPAKAKPLLTITASADVANFSVGQRMGVADLGEAFFRRADALIAGGKVTPKSALASMQLEIPQERKLDPSWSPERNTEIINEVVLQAQADLAKTLKRMRTTKDADELDELTAAGGLCAPIEPRYDVMQIGDDVRPLRDSLPKFFARRGGVRYVTGATIPLMEDLDGSVNIYTEADDTSGDRYPKGCIRIDCPEWEEVLVKAITFCVITGTWQQMTFPEYWRAFWRQGQVLFARTAETELWDDMWALTKKVSAGEGLGATSDVLTQVSRAAQQLKWRYRINPNTPLRMWAPDWLKDILKVDLARRAPGDGLDNTLGATDAQLARWFAARNIAITYVLDAQSPGGTSGDVQAEGALNPWPSTVNVILAPEGTFLGLDMGRLDFGTEIRDFDMIRQNDVAGFYETWEAVAQLGPESLGLTLNICPDGTTAGVDADFDPCTSGS